MGSSLCCSRDMDGLCCSNISPDNRPVAITYSPSNAVTISTVMRLKRNGPSGYNELSKHPISATALD